MKFLMISMLLMSSAFAFNLKCDITRYYSTNGDLPFKSGTVTIRSLASNPNVFLVSTVSDVDESMTAYTLSERVPGQEAEATYIVSTTSVMDLTIYKSIKINTLENTIGITSFVSDSSEDDVRNLNVLTTFMNGKCSAL